MQNTNFNNTNEEYDEIYAFLNRLSILDPFLYWESGRMNFWRYNIHSNKDITDCFFRNNVHLWRNAKQEIVALCISEYGENDVFIEVLPEYYILYPEIFNWIEYCWGTEKPTIEIDVYSENQNKISIMESFGYSFVKHVENKWIYDLNEINLDYRLIEGFSIQSFSESMNFESRVALVCNAFNHQDYSESNVKSLMVSPDYIDEYHLSVVSPEHQHIAYCIGWNDTSKDNWGLIEPVGTHTEFRQKGIGKAIIKECFSRMKSNGIHTALISSLAEPDISNFLYASLEPKHKHRVFRYGKN